MIKVTVLYPNSEDARFDMTYYTGKHMPMVQKMCGPACKSAAAELGLSGGEPHSRPLYIAFGHLTFDSVEAFQNSFVPHAAEILGDAKNFTNTGATLQISEITL